MSIDDLALARALHVLCVAHWIGGVAFVTLCALPLAQAQTDGGRGWALFEAIEKRFAAQVRVTIPLAGASGFWMLWRLDGWRRFADAPGSSWGLYAMAGVWALFMLIVFVGEPLAHRRLAGEAARDPGRVLARLQRAHRVLLTLAAIAIVGGVAAAHGGLWS